MNIKVDKLSAARRQLGVAIKMWFHDEDPVAIHTLMSAAAQIICDLLRHRGLPDFLYENPHIRPEKRREWARICRSDANFFKHADEDPEDEVEFSTEVNDLQLMHCLFSLQQLVVTLNDDELAFWNRAVLERPELFDNDPYVDHPWVDSIRTWSRQRFYEAHRAQLLAQRATAAVGTTVGMPPNA